MDNLSLVHEGDHHFIFAHPDGHQITVAKQALSKNMHDKIRQKFADGGEVNYQVSSTNTVDQDKAKAFRVAMSGQSNPKIQQSTAPQQTPKKYDDGGEVQGPQEIQGPEPEARVSTPGPSGLDLIKSLGSSISDKAKDAYNAINSTDLGHKLLTGNLNSPAPSDPSKDNLINTASDQSPPDQGSSQFASVPLGVPQSQQNPMANLPDYSRQYQGALGQQEQGIKNEANAQGGLAKSQQGIYDKQISQQQSYIDTINKYVTQKQTEADQIKKEYGDGKINPNRVFNDESTGKKFLTGLSLILGGFGSGLQGKANPVLEMLNKQIQNDMDAQQSDKHSLLSRLNQEYGNMDRAKSELELQYNAMAQAQLSKAAAASQNPIVQARAQQAIGQLQAAHLGQSQQLAMQNAVIQGSQSGSGINPAQAIRFLVPEHDQQKAYEELDRVQNAAQQSGHIIDAWHKANSENTLLGRTMHAGFEPASSSNFDNLALPLIKDREGRVNEFEFTTLKKFKPQPGDSPYKTSEKLSGLQNFLAEKRKSSLLNSYNIPIPTINTPRPISAGPQFRQVSYQGK